MAITTNNASPLFLLHTHLRVLLQQIFPHRSLLDDIVHHHGHILDRQSHLLHRVSFSQGDGVEQLALFVDRLEVDRHSERDSDLIGTRIASSDRRRGSIGLEGQRVGAKRRSDAIHDGRELFGVVDGHHGALERRHRRLERHHVSLLLSLADIERVLQDGVDQSAHSEGRLHHRGDELLLVDLQHRRLERHHLGRDGVLGAVRAGADLRGARRRQTVRQLLALLRLLLAQRLQIVLDDRLLLLEGHADRAAVERRSQHVLLDRDVVLHRGRHLHLRGVAVHLPLTPRRLAHLQIEARAVGNAHALRPSVGELDFAVPAVRRVVRHLRQQVLAEPHLLRIDSHALQEQIRARHEVSQRFVVHDSRGHGLAH